MRFNWTYPSGDPSMVLFTRMLERRPLELPSVTGCRVRSLGCAEEDWLVRAQQQNPGMDISGIDARNGPHENAMDSACYEPGSLDLVVCLGSIEHFGLGYYGDPKDPFGDVVTTRNIVRWLVPGGYCFIDVPWTPAPEPFETEHWRCYTDATVATRLIAPGLMEVDRFYAHELSMTPFEERPGLPVEYGTPFHYCTLLLQKPARADEP